MNDSRTPPPPSEAAARHLAEKGIAGIEQVQALVDRAHQMLATGEVAPPPDGEDPHRPPPYPWEVTERRTDVPRRIWVGCVEDFATGEGLTVFFAAGLACGEDEFRRRISLEFGRELAHRAKVGVGVGGTPETAPFLSPNFAAMLERFDRGDDRPAAMSFFARYHANYS